VRSQARALGAVFAILSAGMLPGQFTFELTGQRLDLREGGRPVLAFNHGEVSPPGQGTPRSGYVHPLYAPDGDVLTDDFPADHVHHRGVFVSWPRVTVLGQGVDPWMMRGLRPGFEKWGPRAADEKTARFEAYNVWRLEDEARTAVVREHLRFTVHAADEVGRVIDAHVTLVNLTEQPVTLRGAEKSAYGGLNVRLNGKRPDVQITTARGAVTNDVNALDPPSPWAAHASRVATGQPYSGVAIFQHPANPEYPARNWTLRPYGFLGAAWPGEGAYDLPPHGTLDLRYRLFVHRGTTMAAGVAERFEQYRQAQTTGPAK